MSERRTCNPLQNHFQPIENSCLTTLKSQPAQTHTSIGMYCREHHDGAHGSGNESLVTASRYLIGFHAVTARLRQRAESVQAIYITAARQDRRAREIVELAQTLGIDIHAT